jgi:hypothetical protein
MFQIDNDTQATASYLSDVASLWLKYRLDPRSIRLLNLGYIYRHPYTPTHLIYPNVKAHYAPEMNLFLVLKAFYF